MFRIEILGECQTGGPQPTANAGIPMFFKNNRLPSDGQDMLLWWWMLLLLLLLRLYFMPHGEMTTAAG